MNPSDGALIAAAGALLMLGFTVVLGVEAYFLATGRKPITTYTRNAVEHWPGPSLVIMGVVIFVVGWLTAHFGTDAGCG